MLYGETPYETNKMQDLLKNLKEKESVKFKDEEIQELLKNSKKKKHY